MFLLLAAPGRAPSSTSRTWTRPQQHPVTPETQRLDWRFVVLIVQFRLLGCIHKLLLDDLSNIFRMVLQQKGLCITVPGQHYRSRLETDAPGQWQSRGVNSCRFT